MGKIIIKNFGPVRDFMADTDKKLMIAIGEQASGKSTIAKSVFFCKSISEELKKYLIDTSSIMNVSKKISLITAFKKRLRTKFVEYFGTTKHMAPFAIYYTFDNNEKVTITLSGGYAKIAFSGKLEQSCLELAEKVRNFYMMEESEANLEEKIDLSLWSNHYNKLAKKINVVVDRLFEQEYTSIFIPAGRSMLATNSEFFHTLTPNKYDILMNDFIERIMILQKQYSQKMEDIVRDKRKMSSEEIDFAGVKKATVLVKRILKGEYVNEKSGEKIYYNDNEFVKLIQASSGQQESLWIVLLLFSIILNHQKVCLVIEEPEAHLFPNAQKDVMELIALMINSTDSQVVLTTHSPYILTSANLFIYSGHIENNKDSEDDIVPKNYRLNAEEVSAYAIRDYVVSDIMDVGNYMIDASKIDEVSEVLNEATDRLIEREGL